MWANLTKDAVHSYSKPEVATLKKDGSNKSDFFVCDVVGAQKFARNFGGHPRSDLALINEQNDLRVAENLLNRLQDFGSAPDTNAGLSDTEILLAHRSKYCQAPAEQIAYFESELNRRASLKETTSQPPKDNVIQFDNTDTETKENS